MIRIATLLACLSIAACAGPEDAGQRVGRSLYDASVTTGRALSRAGDATGSALQNAGSGLRRTFNPEPAVTAMPPGRPWVAEPAYPAPVTSEPLPPPED